MTIYKDEKHEHAVFQACSTIAMYDKYASFLLSRDLNVEKNIPKELLEEVADEGTFLLNQYIDLEQKYKELLEETNNN